MSARPMQRVVPSPPPGAGRAGASLEPAALPPLPVAVQGAPPGRPPGVQRGAPHRGGLRGLGAPPEVRRRTPGAVRAAPGASAIADQMRAALRASQQKLLASKAKLQVASAALRARLAERG